MWLLKSRYLSEAKHGTIGLTQVAIKQGRKSGLRSNYRSQVLCLSENFPPKAPVVSTGSRPKNCSERLWNLSGGHLSGRVGHWTQGLLTFLVAVIRCPPKAT